MAAGRSLRANNSLAPSLGSFGLASGGKGFGSTLPLSCAEARVPLLASAKIANVTIRTRRDGMDPILPDAAAAGNHQSGIMDRNSHVQRTMTSPRALRLPR